MSEDKRQSNLRLAVVLGVVALCFFGLGIYLASGGRF